MKTKRVIFRELWALFVIFLLANAAWAQGTINVEGISLDRSELTLGKDRNEKLTVTITPTDATNKDVLWESRNEEVAKVNTNGLVTGIDEGETYIVATTVDGLYQDSCLVSVTITHVEGVSVKQRSITVSKGRNELLSANIAPDNATNREVQWESRNEDIVTIISVVPIGPVSTILFSAVEEGETYIVVTTADGSYQDSCLVTITPYLGINMQEETISVYPNPTKGLLYLNIDNLREDVKVYTAHGRLIRILIGDEVNLSDLPNGVYILQAGNRRVRVVKN